MKFVCQSLLACCGICAFASMLSGEGTADKVKQVIINATNYFVKHASRHDGYVYYYSLDMKKAWGEGEAGPDTVFVQSPGTPTVGSAYLLAYQATGEQTLLAAAQKTALCLTKGQLESGGWTQTIEFGATKRPAKYRLGAKGNWNNSSLDDGQTQDALQFLIQLDRELKFADATIHDAVVYGLNKLLQAQYANGAFPQVWNSSSAMKSILSASYPNYNWKTEQRYKNYWELYTLNDGLAGTVAETLILADQVYGNKEYAAALKKLGDFLVLAQMPEPQPAWCQQYTFEMKPAWARKFEPPAISSWESQDVIQTLLKISLHIKDMTYLKPIPKAIQYLESCESAEGKFARFYELKTNKPLYMDRQYQLTYSDQDVPEHYGWKQPNRLKSLKEQYTFIQSGSEGKKTKHFPDIKHVEKIINSCDSMGRWVDTFEGQRLVGQPKFTKGFQYLSSETFSNHLRELSLYIISVEKNK